MAGPSGASSSSAVFNATQEEAEIRLIEKELKSIESQISVLHSKKKELQKKKEQLTNRIHQKKSESLAKKNWDKTDFPWSQKLADVMKNTFKLDKLRPHQLPTINASMSKEDVILIMPTGGGKSLCYQLPALLSPGFTLVVSPLVALMEDQLMALKALNIDAAMLCSTATREEVNSVQQSMTNPKASLKLLYVTPEKLAKSKRFMSKLQKAFSMDLFARLAIDEVHCCSQWGHDFRPDYKFLGIMKAMFPGVPILGLTATATSKIVTDVQDILNIQGCLVLKASFNRPNLYYEVREKSSNQKECIEALETLLKDRFRNQSGIIYTTSIRDAEELTTALRSKNLRVGCYHATLDAGFRSKVHKKWISGEYQAVIATIAFGLGIDKPDVRFVIHHSISKSMENFYQESGRAGRDDKPAECIVFYRLADVFKLSTMVFTQRTGLENLYGIVAYCLDSVRCRRSVIAQHFGERWESADCNRSCDHCRRPLETREVDITNYCVGLYRILAQAVAIDVRVTAQKLVEAWLGKGQTNLRSKDVKVPPLSREQAEAVVAHLLIEGYLKEDFHYTAYSTISYLVPGPHAGVVGTDSHRVTMTIGGKRKLVDISDCTKTSLKSNSAGGKIGNTKSEKDMSLKRKSDDVEILKSKKSDLNNKRKYNDDTSDEDLLELCSDFKDDEIVKPLKRKKSVVIVSDSESDESVHAVYET